MNRIPIPLKPDRLYLQTLKSLVVEQVGEEDIVTVFVDVPIVQTTVLPIEDPQFQRAKCTGTIGRR